MADPKAPEVPEGPKDLEDVLHPAVEETITLSNGLKVRLMRPSITDPKFQEAEKINMEVIKSLKDTGVIDSVLNTRVITSLARACAVVDENQREFTEDEWIQIFGSCEENVAINPLVVRLQEMAQEAHVGRFEDVKISPT